MSKQSVAQAIIEIDKLFVASDKAGGKGRGTVANLARNKLSALRAEAEMLLSSSEAKSGVSE